MAARSGVGRLLLALPLAAVALGCVTAAAIESKASGQAALPPQTLAPPPTRDPADDPPPPPTPPTTTAALAGAPAKGTEPIDLTNPPPAPTRDPTLVFIEPAPSAPVGEPTSLAEAAARERLRRQGEAPPAVVINNKNLAEYAAGGVLTIAEPAMVAAEADGAEAETPVGPSIEEAYWRQRGLEIRRRWRESVDRIPELVARVEELRQRFYSTDDPAYRDGEIKPLWDKALADLEEARWRAERGAEEVLDYLEEGRRAGALPGWLREGAELEPEPVVERLPAGEVEPDPAEPQEPVIYEEPARDP
jgi:hypothetical protein